MIQQVNRSPSLSIEKVLTGKGDFVRLSGYWLSVSGRFWAGQGENTGVIDLIVE